MSDSDDDESEKFFDCPQGNGMAAEGESVDAPLLPVADVVAAEPSHNGCDASCSVVDTSEDTESTLSISKWGCSRCKDRSRNASATSPREGKFGDEKILLHSVIPTQLTVATFWPPYLHQRSQLPAVMFSRHDFSVWSILKQCIGRELSKITMPVIFNEPISFLQRITEYMEYAPLLQKASESDSVVERLEYVTAFAVSATAANWDRLGKPFNPLLAETFELVREDLGFRMVCEQVSHHPPVSAFHSESPLYTFHGTIHPKLKFWGKTIEITPKGSVTLHLLKHGEVYCWQNASCYVHNIIVGKLWIEHFGLMEVTNLTTKHKAVIDFKPCGWFGHDLHKLEGFLYDENQQPTRVFYGKWIEALLTCDPDVWHQRQPYAQPPPHAEKVTLTNCQLHLPSEKLLWVADKKPQDADQYYSFTLFTMMLNELCAGDAPHHSLPLTDSRLRGDIRRMEDGDMDGAADEKARLEEKQRVNRKERRRHKEDWRPRWFKYSINSDTEKADWIFTDKYWLRDWTDVPDIF